MRFESLHGTHKINSEDPLSLKSFLSLVDQNLCQLLICKMRAHMGLSKSALEINQSPRKKFSLSLYLKRCVGIEATCNIVKTSSSCMINIVLRLRHHRPAPQYHNVVPSPSKPTRLPFISRSPITATPLSARPYLPSQSMYGGLTLDLRLRTNFDIVDLKLPQTSGRPTVGRGLQWSRWRAARDNELIQNNRDVFNHSKCDAWLVRSLDRLAARA